MPDHILPHQAASSIITNTNPSTSLPISAARPPTYSPFTSDNSSSLQTLSQKNSYDRHQNDDNDNPSNDDPQNSSHALLGVPDRSASASAPPDLEISSRSLFAFKTNYSGIFDIRMDEDYESFYNDNPERMNLPPPLVSTNLQSRQQQNSNDDNNSTIIPNSNSTSTTSSNSHPPKSSQLSQTSIFSSHTTSLDHSIVTSNEKPALHQPSANLPPRVSLHSSTSRSINSVPISSTSSPNAAAFAALNIPSQLTHALSRDDSVASFDDLIFRESRQMRPITGSSPGFYRDDDALTEVVASMQRPATAPPPEDFGFPQEMNNNLPATTVHSAFLQDPPQSNGIGNQFGIRHTRSTSRTPQDLRNYNDDSLRKQPLKVIPERIVKVIPTTNHKSSNDDTSSNSQPLMLSSSSSLPSQHDQHFQLPSSDSMTNHASKHISFMQQQHQSFQSQPQQDLDVPLWKLGQLSIDDHESLSSAAQGATSVYGGIPTAYDSTNNRNAFGSTYNTYQQQDPTGQMPVAAAAAAAAAAMAAAHQPSQVPYMQQSIRNQQDWPQQSSVDNSRKNLNSFDARSSVVPMFPSSTGTTIADMLNIDNGNGSPGAYGSISPSMTTLPYDSANTRDTSTSGYTVQRSRYVQQHQSNSNGRISVYPNRRNSPIRMENGSESYNYNVYGNNNERHGSYGATRNRAMPFSPEFVNAQAAAAAAAAAAAVYQRNRVHLNGTSPLAPLHPGTPSGSVHSRTGGHRNVGRNHDSRRGNNGTHQDSYPRGNHGGNNLTRGSGHGQDRGILDRSANSNDNMGNGATNNLRISSFNDVIGRAEELARDQHGCRYLQTKLEESNVLYINSIFHECYEKFVDLMTDPFGNYLCQKLFEYCNDAQRLALVERCASAIPQVSANMHGTRAVQRMVECLSRPEEIRVVCEALRPAAVSLMKDINGNHVIQRCLHRMEPEDNQFVYDSVSEHCFELATHRHGCCVMQRCIDYASTSQSNQLVGQITANALPLVKNAFGNYVVQYVLALDNPGYNTDIIHRLQGNLAELSMQKFSSNVVEKSLQLGSRDLRRELIDELISDPETMPKLLHDAYGNYVIQKTLNIAEGGQLDRICEAIRPHLNSLRQSPFGKRIQAKILKRMPKGVTLLPSS